MARSVVDAWLVEEQGSEVIRVVNQNSALEAFARPEPMKSYTKTIPRSGAVGVAVKPKGSAYAEDAGTVDEITITTRTFGVAVRIAEEDIEDQLVDILNEKKIAFGNSYAVTIDNACLGTTAATNGTTVPFTSVYRALTQADASVGYTANANLIQTAAGGPQITYANVRALVAKYEASPFYDQAAGLAIAHPMYRDQFRGIVDSQGRPMFIESLTDGSPDRFFGYDLKFSLGARGSATASNAPTGNPLFFLGNRNLLRLGKRSGPESAVIDGRTGLAALTDESLLIMRARRGFAVGDIRGWAALEQLA